MGILFTLVLCSLFGAAVAYCAQLRGRDPITWFVIGLLFGIFGLFALFYLPRLDQKAPPAEDVKPYVSVRGSPFEDWWYLNAQRQIQGPLSANHLEQKILDNEIPPDTLVWKEDMAEWEPAKKFFS